MTASLPEIAAAIDAVPARSLVLDAEVIALEAGGRPRPFQDTMRRFGRRLDVAAAQAELPLSVFCFDCLHFDGEDLLDQPAELRFEKLGAAVPAALIVPRIVTSDIGAAETFLRTALDAGHEGLMAKDLGSAYEAGSRGSSWLKIKVAHTLDLVVLAAEWGNGRRHGWLSNLHLGARDPETGDFVMLGKTFKGLTDERLAWQTEQLQALATGTEAATSSTSARSSWSRSRSTSCKRAGAIQAGSRYASRASCATGRTRPRRTPTRSTPCERSPPDSAHRALRPLFPLLNVHFLPDFGQNSAFSPEK